MTAAPENGWTFIGWRGEATGTNLLLTLTMDTHKTVEGVFGRQLSFPNQPGGTVTRNPDLKVYPYGTTVTLTAQTNAGFAFQSWGDSYADATRTVMVTDTSDFQPVFVPLSVLTNPPPRFTSAALRAGGTLELVLSGGPGSHYSLQTSTDLQAWWAFTTLTNLTGSVTYTEPLDRSTQAKLYRAILVP